jgi:hypothetical protein
MVVAKVHRDVAYVAIVVHVYWKVCYQCFICAFGRMSQVCLSGCCIYFIHMLHVFHLGVAYVCKDFQVLSGVFFSSVSKACCKCVFQMFYSFQTYVASVLSKCCICCSGYTYVASICFICFRHMLLQILNIASVLWGTSGPPGVGTPQAAGERWGRSRASRRGGATGHVQATIGRAAGRICMLRCVSSGGYQRERVGDSHLTWR